MYATYASTHASVLVCVCYPQKFHVLCFSLFTLLKSTFSTVHGEQSLFHIARLVRSLINRTWKGQKLTETLSRAPGRRGDCYTWRKSRPDSQVCTPVCVHATWIELPSANQLSWAPDVALGVYYANQTTTSRAAQRQGSLGSPGHRWVRAVDVVPPPLCLFNFPNY